MKLAINPLPVSETSLGIGTLRFASPPPLFPNGRNYDEQNPPRSITRSVYYWWFVCLRENSDYREACERRGSGNTVFDKLFRDLGDVRRCTFWQWWGRTMFHFCEPKRRWLMGVSTNCEELAPFGRRDVVNLRVPLGISSAEALKQFSAHVLPLLIEPPAGQTFSSKCRYQVRGVVKEQALRTDLKVYRIRTEMDKGTAFSRRNRDGTITERTRYEVSWPEVAIRAGMIERVAKGRTVTRDVSDRQGLGQEAKRAYNRALKLIEAAASHSFPRCAPPKKQRISGGSRRSDAR
ncbi:MAG TPA: hypothetical protein VHA82_12320 [Ramlibacter sp.]|uniref:hypothetical protein n=1 Tax=Ramlibacter sp. TaxID=1917967 RepID=UPI002CB437BB|nr:hypothetical protein [Ramlibacter sp.]HVZ44586.1 hypothetical protein [Ramlibacter sp.]